MHAATGSARLKLKVIPGASRTEIVGWLGQTLKVRVSAPPERGKANAAVEAVIAETLGISSDAVRIVSGKTSENKNVEIRQMTLEQVHQKLAGHGFRLT